MLCIFHFQTLYGHIFTSTFYYTNTDSECKAEKLWYSADYSDMHIVSLSINRLYFWDPYEAPGWRMYDSIEADSPQIKWLINDLSNTRKKYKWVIQHFHMLICGRKHAVKLVISSEAGILICPESVIGENVHLSYTL